MLTLEVNTRGLNIPEPVNDTWATSPPEALSVNTPNFEPLADGEKLPTNWYDKMMKNFSGFQETLNKTLGSTVGNFVTGSAGAWAVSKLPSILKF